MSSPSTVTLDKRNVFVHQFEQNMKTRWPGEVCNQGNQSFIKKLLFLKKNINYVGNKSKYSFHILRILPAKRGLLKSSKEVNVTGTYYKGRKYAVSLRVSL